MASIFTQIINREIPAQVVYENDHVISFMDINPKSLGHTLVVPKMEVAAYQDLPPDVAAHLASACQLVVRGVTRAMKTPHYNLTLNNGTPAGQVIFHVHFHVIPRYEGADRSERPKVDSGKLQEMADSIKQAIDEAGSN